jgi:dipeptidyl aminopeptidase/acylaminoacyl peptidase
MRHVSLRTALALSVAAATLPFPTVLGAQDGAASAPSATRSAAPRDRIALEDYFDFEDVQDPQLSPDGKQVIFTRRWVDKMNDKWESSLWIMNVDGTRPRSLVTGSNARWSPDGTRIAYFAEGQPRGTQIFVRFMDQEQASTQITHVTDAPSNLEWSPDGKSIAFQMNVPTQDDWRIAMPAMPKGAKWTEPPKVVTRVQYRSDRVGYIDNGYRHIFIVPAEGGTARQLTSGNWNYGAPEWTRDGKAIVFSGLQTADWEYAWRESDIYSIDVATAQIRQLTNRKGPDGNPTISPNGKWIAYTGYDSTGATWQDAKLYVMDVDGSNKRVLTEKLDRSPQGMIWAVDNSGVYFNVENEGSRNLYFVPLAAGEPRAITKGSHVLTVSSIDRNGNAVGVLSTFTKPNDVYALNLKAPAPTPKQLTWVNEDIFGGKKIGEGEEIWYTSVDGFKIQGWVIKPPDFDPKKKYPLILDIHGGPHAMYNVGFSFARQDEASHGYVVLYTNPRGSTGYGSAFGNAIKNAYPGKDYNDLMAGVDTVIGRGYIDARNLFVHGCSGGGVLTAWTVGHTDRFAAAASMCPVINWMSFVGNTDGPSWYRNFEKFPWEDPSEHLRRSPLMYVGNVKTPTLLMTGVNDLRTPIGQTEEFYEALKQRKVPTAMVRFNDEWHGTSSKPSNFLRTQLYLQSWFARYTTKGATATTQ